MPMRPLKIAGVALNEEDLRIGVTKSDLAFYAEEVGEDIVAALSYSTDLFTAETARRMVEEWEGELEQVVADPEVRIGDVELMTEQERGVLRGWNQTEREYPRGRCIHELFEEQVKRDEGAIAIRYGEEEMTYGELNRRANQVGHYLRNLGVGPE